MKYQTDSADNLTQANTHKPVADLVGGSAIRVEGHATEMKISGRRAKEWRDVVTAPTGTLVVTIPCVTGNEEAAVELILADQQLVRVRDVSSHTVPQSISTSTFTIVISRHYGLARFPFGISLVSSLVIDEHYFCEFESENSRIWARLKV